MACDATRHPRLGFDDDALDWERAPKEVCPVSSAELMQRYCEGNNSAFRELYAATAPRLLGYLRSLAGDDATAEEILQQTFLKLHGARSVYVRGMDPVPWLYAIAHRTCIDDMRRRRRSRIHLLRGSEDRRVGMFTTAAMTAAASVATRSLANRRVCHEIESGLVVLSFGNAVAATIS